MYFIVRVLLIIEISIWYHKYIKNLYLFNKELKRYKFSKY